ncbi:COX15/CtaA family protein [Aureibaculum sp. 2210JD6-5]|uniref:COX15/CtaA family protein n=1 Tax=Aureibaculum sp. 2210JD6-5 TaxID=3103957 RepID=UPI002AAE0491|nr:COX15/CtaA family protein [Aureibaculum sp. 2210JD6-5]MDY7394927.1 COX15/CtaA family protein [Aureibaculum sp. 2210JD6-5]
MTAIKKYKYTKTIRIWLIIGLVMLIGQVVLGGITRLTGSGLSITRWDIISGTIPPLNAEQWQEAFNLYKETPQYRKINSHFDLSDFKFIYFWEYFHRLWVRILGFIFLIPFVIFIIRKKINFYLIKRLLLVVVFAALTASAGWIMVKSGLINRPWVNAYKLTLHFILALISIAFMVKTIADVYNYKDTSRKKNSPLLPIIILVTFVQMIFAGLMAGMKAGLYYPTWPDMNGYFLPEVLQEADNWKLINLTNYDTFTFAPALVQFTHRLFAYLLVALTVYLFYKYRKAVSRISQFWLNTITLLIFLQLVLGIITVLNIKPGIPLVYGVLHQLVGLLFFISLFFFYFSMRSKNKV